MVSKISNKNDPTIEPPDNNRLFAEDKEFFTIQFEANENIIARLKENYIVLEKDTDKYKKKSNYLNIKFKNEYEDREKMLEEKNKFEKILKAEITDLLQEKDSMLEIYKNRLKKEDDQFMKSAGVIKSTTAVYVGRLNKLKEYCLQEEMFEVKLINLKQQIEFMDINYEVKLKELEEKYVHHEKVIPKEILKRRTEFEFLVNKHCMSNLHPRVQDIIKENFDREDMLLTFREQNVDIKNVILQKKEENQRFIMQIKSNKKIINTIKDALCAKNENVKELKKELAEALVAVKNLSGNSDGKIIEHRTAEQDEHDTLRSAIDDTVHKLRALNSDGQAVREELSGIRAANGNLDRYIWDTEEVLLLNAFREVLNRVEEIKSNNIDWKEKTMGFIQKLHTELDCLPKFSDVEPFIIAQ